jgi:hypothetical protein
MSQRRGRRGAVGRSESAGRAAAWSGLRRARDRRDGALPRAGAATGRRAIGVAKRRGRRVRKLPEDGCCRANRACLTYALRRASRKSRPRGGCPGISSLYGAATRYPRARGRRDLADYEAPRAGSSSRPCASLDDFLDRREPCLLGSRSIGQRGRARNRIVSQEQDVGWPIIDSSARLVGVVS